MRKTLLSLLGVVCVSVAFAASARPNILLIVSDDQGYGDFSCFDNKYLKTPNLDKLKSESIWLERLYMAPLCSPTRAALMTGRDQFRTGVWDTWQGRSNLAADEWTLAEYLRLAGYETGIFGKWHLGDNLPFRPEDQGFDETFIWNNDDRFKPTFSKRGETVDVGERFLDDAITDEALRFIRQKRDRPFFSYVAFFMPHSHFRKQVPDDYVKPYAIDELPRQADREVYGMVAKLDEGVGRLLDGLEAEGLAKDTLVIFLSDNGPQRVGPDTHGAPRFNLGLRGGKGNVFEGGIREPGFVRWPGRLVPRAIAQPVAVIDILPTVLEAVGAPPADRKPLDGVSLWPLLMQSEPLGADRFIFQQQQPQRSGRVPELFYNACVIGPRFKLVFLDGEASARLYDVVDDKEETTDLASQRPEVVDQMKTAYRQWFADVAGERGFGPLVTRLGDPKQRTVLLGMSHFNEREGFPLMITRAGRYRVQIEQIQSQLFPSGGAIGVKIGEAIASVPVMPDQTEEETVVTLPEGHAIAVPYAEGKVPKKFVYGNEDVGFRRILITGPEF